MLGRRAVFGLAFVPPLVAVLLAACRGSPDPPPFVSSTPNVAPSSGVGLVTTFHLRVLTDAEDEVTVLTAPVSQDSRFAEGTDVALTATCGSGTVHWQTTAIGRGVVETITNRTTATLLVLMDQDRVVFVRCVARLGG